MANSSFLTTFIRHRDPKLLWPVAAVASVLTHGLALGMVRTLAIQTPALPDGAMAPLPIQLVTLPPDQAAPGAEPSVDPSADPSADLSTTQMDLAPGPPTPLAPQTTPPDPAASETAPAPVEPAPTPSPAPPLSDSPPVAPAPRPTPAPAAPPLPTANRPTPPRPTPPVSPAPVSPAPGVSRPPRVDAPPQSESPSVSPAPPVSPAPVSPAPEAAPEAPAERAGQVGQVVPVGLRLDPSGRDIPDAAPQLLGASAIDMQPLASSCGFANLEALLAGMTTATVQMQIRVETSGEISNVRLLQSTGRSAVDELVGCVVRQRLRLQPASSAGVPQLTDAYILDARIQFF